MMLFLKSFFSPYWLWEPKFLKSSAWKINEDMLRVFKLAVTGTSTSYNLIGVVGSVAEPVGAGVSAVVKVRLHLR